MNPLNILKSYKKQDENKHLRQDAVHIQAKAEQEEEFISNTLLKKIQALKKEKENLQLHMLGKLQSNKAKQAVKIFLLYSGLTLLIFIPWYDRKIFI